MVLKVGGGCHNAGLVCFIEWEQVDEKINEIKEKVEMKAYLLLLRSAMEQCLSVLSIIQLICFSGCHYYTSIVSTTAGRQGLGIIVECSARIAGKQQPSC